jgi:hypothetical protein
MNKQISLDPFLDAAISEVLVTLQGTRKPRKGQVAYAKGITEKGTEVFVYPHRDDETWQLHCIDCKGLKVKVSLGAPLDNGVVKSRLVPFESQPAEVKAIVRRKQAALRESVQAEPVKPAPKASKPKPAKPKAPKVIERDSARRRAQKHAKDKGLTLLKDRSDGSFYILSATNKLKHKGLTLEAAMELVGFKLADHEQLEGHQ